MHRFWNQILFFISISSLALLSFIYGVALARFDDTPLINKAINGVYALAYDVYNRELKPDTYKTKNFFWVPERYQKKGVVIHQDEKYSEAFTLILSAHHQGAELINKAGELVHQWNFQYESIMDSFEKKPDGKFVYWWQSHLFPNGDLLALVTVDNLSPAGMGVIKIDKNSELLWHKAGNFHHDFDVDKQGNIYLLAQSIADTVPENRNFIPTPVLDESFVILDKNGEQLKTINIYDAIVNSPYKNILKRLNSSIASDYLHPNGIEYIDDKKAKYTSYLKANSVIIDLREIDMIIAIDIDSEEVFWISVGPWHKQHDPDLLTNGNFLIFDNQSLNQQSRVIEFDPRTQKIIWEYRGTKELPLYSSIRAGQQKLHNGNVLIYESNGSRVLEVDIQGELVWEYYSTERRQDEGIERLYVPVIMSAQRYAKFELPFLEDSDK